MRSNNPYYDRYAVLVKSRENNEIIAKSYCGRCGPDSIIDVFTGACMSCPSFMDETKSLRHRSIDAGGDRYMDICPSCGVVGAHYVRNLRCVECFLPSGIRRKAPHIYTERERARMAALREFDAVCRHHGVVPHDTRTNKCLTCYDRAGRVRGPGKRAVSNTPRSAARRAGEKTYPDFCHKHGDTAHSVKHGRCLECFNMMGYARPARSAG